MGTASATATVQVVNGYQTQVPALTTTAGATDAGGIPALNAVGVLDPSLINAVSTSAGTASAGKVTMLNGAGTLDLTLMPSGLGPTTKSIIASEALAAGAWINLWANSGVFNVRNADGAVWGKFVDGFVLAPAAASTMTTVYFSGENTAVTNQVPGRVFLSKTPGQGTAVPITGKDCTSQIIGIATSATSVSLDLSQPIRMAQ